VKLASPDFKDMHCQRIKGIQAVERIYFQDFELAAGFNDRRCAIFADATYPAVGERGRRAVGPLFNALPLV
jgi:hypothetical protein